MPTSYRSTMRPGPGFWMPCAHLAAVLLAFHATAAFARTPTPTRTPLPRAVATAPRAPATVARDAVYCTVDRVSLTMDVYSPGGVSARPRPLVLFVHGGGFVTGDKDSSAIRSYMRDLTARGYVGASLNYRLAPAYRFPAMLEDVKCAVRHFRTRAAKYGIDPLRIGVMGSSAGGQLAALVGVTDRRAGFEGTGGYLNQSSRVQAVVDLYGHTDMTVSMPRGQRNRLLAAFGSDEGLRLGSPVAYVSGDDPPFLIIHGDRDLTVPLSQSELLAGRLRAVGVPATLQVVRNADHGFDAAGPGLVSPDHRQRLRMIGEFFDRVLR